MSRGNDPLPGYRFEVGLKINGAEVAAFSEVSGLQCEIETEDYREGGVNDYVHKLPKTVKYQNVVLKRGFTESKVLWDWYQKTTQGKINRQSVNVVLMDMEENSKWTWTVENAYPVKWSGPDFKSDSNGIAVETLELAHQGITKS